MAARAIRSLLCPVHILVAGSALPAKAQKRMIEIFFLDLRARAGWYEFRYVALLARKGLVFPFQGHARFSRMIKGLTVQPDQREFFAVVVRVTSRAVRLAAGTLVLSRVVAGVGLQPMLDLNMTLEALKVPVARARPEIVARRAFSDALQLLVSA